MFIMNEKEFIENLIDGVADIRDFDISYQKIISLLCKYYREESMIYDKLFYIYRDVENFHIEKYMSVIDQILKETIKNDWLLRERDYIEIYKSDLDAVNSLDTNREKKVMFSLIVLARYYDNNGSTNVQDGKSRVEFFKLANVSLKIEDRGKLLHKLFVQGLIKMSKKNIKNNILIVNMEHDDCVVMKIKEIKNLGNQYMEYLNRQ